MSAVDSQATSITIGGTTIGGLESFEMIEGQSREATFRPLNGAPAARPLQPDFGYCNIYLIRDDADPGQAALKNSWKNKTRHTFVVTHDNGQTDTFNGFCVLLPTRGSKNASDPVNRGRAVIRINGAIT